MTDAQLLADLEAAGTGLHQRLAVVEYSSIPSLQREARIIKAELARRRPDFMRRNGC